MPNGINGDIELITGYSGEAHIASEDDGGGYASIVGVNTYLSSAVGEKCRAELVDNNTLRIYDGELWFGGRHCRIATGTYVEVALDSGEQNRKRIDLVLLHYEKAADTGIETVDIRVKKGISTTGIPQDPSYQKGSPIAGDLVAETPLYRITINGLTAATPERVAASLPQIGAVDYTATTALNKAENAQMTANDGVNRANNAQSGADRANSMLNGGGVDEYWSDWQDGWNVTAHSWGPIRDIHVQFIGRLPGEYKYTYAPFTLPEKYRREMYTDATGDTDWMNAHDFTCWIGNGGEIAMACDSWDGFDTDGHQVQAHFCYIRPNWW